MLGQGLAHGLGVAPAASLASLGLSLVGPFLGTPRFLSLPELVGLTFATAIGAVLAGLVLLPAVELARRAPRRWRLPVLVLAGAGTSALLSVTAAWVAMVVLFGPSPGDVLASMDAYVLDWWREHPGEGAVDLAVGLCLFTGCGAGLLQPLSRRLRLGLALLGGGAAWAILALGDGLYGQVMLLPDQLWRQPGALLVVPLSAALGLELGPRVDRALRALWEAWIQA